jgi:hypothetical protein
MACLVLNSSGLCLPAVLACSFVLINVRHELSVMRSKALLLSCISPYVVVEVYILLHQFQSSPSKKLGFSLLLDL